MGWRDVLQRLFVSDPPPGDELLRDTPAPPAPGAAPSPPASAGTRAVRTPAGAQASRAATPDPWTEVTAMPLPEGVARAMELLTGETTRAGALALLRWLREVSAGDRLGATQRLALADFFASRGEPETCLRALTAMAAGAVADAPPAMMALGDRASQQGDQTTAARWYESVLAIDLEYPGARERLARLRQPTRAGDAGATLLAPDGRAGLGRFELVRELGRGSAGAVFQARDKRMQRAVALKLYHPQARSDRDARLRGEAQVAASVASPCVVRVYDLFVDVGGLAMEYASGQSLRQRVARNGFDTPVARGWLDDLAHALASTHAQRWVHRDVKPGNVLLRRDGRAVLTDFGLARRAGDLSPLAEGTAGYMAPELAAGVPADPRMDVFAFGALGRELLGPGDPHLDDLLAQCVEPDPARRPANGAALRDAMNKLRPG